MDGLSEYEIQSGEAVYRLRLALPLGLCASFADAPRSVAYRGSLPRDWKVSYFRMFLNHAADRDVIRALVAAIQVSGLPATGERLLEALVAFVQSAIAYDWPMAAQASSSKKIHYPSETLLDRKGVCADKTILLAAVLYSLGYRIAVLCWERANHMALGIAVPNGQGNFGSEYAMIETTASTAIGVVPDEYAGGIRLDEAPEIVELGGTRLYQGLTALRKREQDLASKYGTAYLKMSSTQRSIYRQMQPLKADIESLSRQLARCQGSLSHALYTECQRLSLLHNAKVEILNALVVDFNRASTVPEPQPTAPVIQSL